MRSVKLPLQFKLDDGHGLVHLSDEAYRLLVVCVSPIFYFGDKRRVGAVFVRLHGKGCQRHHVDAVALLKCLRVGVAQRKAQHACNTGLVSSGGSHPQNVVVAPLDVQMMVVAERVHNQVGTWSAVINVAEDVQTVDGQALDEVADGYDEMADAARADDGLDDDVEVSLLVVVLRRLVQQFLNDVCKFFRQALAHL